MADRITRAAKAMAADFSTADHEHTCQGCQKRYVCQEEPIDLGFDSDMDCRWYEFVLCLDCRAKGKSS